MEMSGTVTEMADALDERLRKLARIVRVRVPAGRHCAAACRSSSSWAALSQLAGIGAEDVRRLAVPAGDRSLSAGDYEGRRAGQVRGS